MDETSLIDENFFVIDSENLAEVKTRLYGFALSDDGRIVQDGDELEAAMQNVRGGGTFVWVNHTESNISIQQDIDGSYGLYVFKNDNYFALSNSFFRLVEYLYERHPLSFNADYAAAFISLPLNSMAFSSTLIKEIEMLPRNVRVEIDCNGKTLNIQEIDYKENSIDIESDEAFAVLDDWYARWTGLLRDLKSKTDAISIDLTGGFDSRVAFLIALGADIDLNRVRVNSSSDGLHTHGEDFEIASAIASRFGFALNQAIRVPHIPFKEIKTPMGISWYAKAGFHKQMYWKLGFRKEPVFAFGGSGGEVVNGHGMLGVVDGNTFLENQVKRAQTFSRSFAEPVRRVMQDTLTGVAKEYGVSEDCPYISLLLYRDTVSRNHFGKNNVEQLLSNNFSLQPLMDPMLRQVKTSCKKCEDTRLLMAVLLSRYCPQLLEFPFQDGRKIEDQTLDYAKRLNAEHPFKRELCAVISEPTVSLDVQNICEIQDSDVSLPAVQKKDIEEKIFNTFKSTAFKNMFQMFFSEEVYSRILTEASTRAFFPLQEVYACIVSMQMAEYAHYGKMNADRKSDFFSRILSVESLQGSSISSVLLPQVKKYLTARLDIKNIGAEQNTVELVSGGESLSWSAYPAWFTNEQGKGFVAQSERGTVSMELCCVGTGELKIWLRGVDSRDKNGKRFPVWIDFTRLAVDGVEVFTGSHMVWHDKPFVHAMRVADGQTVRITAEWRPFCEESIQILPPAEKHTHKGFLKRAVSRIRKVYRQNDV